MISAVWNGVVIAESDATVVVEGNHHFPPVAISREHFRDGAAHTVCGWKGTAGYYDVVAGDAVNRDGAWFYPEPKDAASQIAGYVAFWRGAKVES